MRVSLVVQPGVEINERWCDPGSIPVRAASDDCLECFVCRDSKLSSSDLPVQVVGNVEVVERKMGAGIGGIPPYDARSVVPHREKPVCIGSNEDVRG